MAVDVEVKRDKDAGTFGVVLHGVENYMLNDEEGELLTDAMVIIEGLARTVDALQQKLDLDEELQPIDFAVLLRAKYRFLEVRKALDEVQEVLNGTKSAAEAGFPEFGPGGEVYLD